MLKVKIDMLHTSYETILISPHDDAMKSSSCYVFDVISMFCSSTGYEACLLVSSAMHLLYINCSVTELLWSCCQRKNFCTIVFKYIHAVFDLNPMSGDIFHLLFLQP